MKSKPPLSLLLLIALATLPIILWATATQNADLRGRAQGVDPTPTATPSATPTSTLTPTLTPAPTNTPPRCNGISVNPGAGTKPLTVSFSCAGYDPDNDITAAEFGLGGDLKRLVEKNVGQFGSITTTHTYSSPGTYRVTCKLRDNNQAFSTMPGYCQYTIYVSDNALTPTPIRTPTPTRKPSQDIAPIIYTGAQPTTITPSPTTAIPTPIPTATPESPAFWSNEKVSQLIMMVIVSGVTMIIALLLYGFFDKR